MFDTMIWVTLCIYGEVFAKSLPNNLGNSEDVEELSNTRNIHDFLTKYLELKFPNLNEQELLKVKIVFVQKLKKKMIQNRKKKHLKRMWKMKEHSFARMLR